MALTIHRLKIDAAHAGRRLDNFLFSRFKNVPKSHIYRIVRNGEVRLNKRRADASSRLSPGDELRVPLRDAATETVAHPEPSAADIEDLRRRVLFEDERLLVVNKAVGEVVHAGSRHRVGLVDKLKRVYGDDALTLLHRLDRGTTGCLLFSKSRATTLVVHEAFRERTVAKVYLALVAGRWPERLRRVTGEDADGKRMETGFSVKRRYAGQTLLEARPLSGRTHQIRIQTAEKGHAIIGDRKYGERAHHADLPATPRRLFLHAWKLSFVLDGRRLRFEAPPGDDWSGFVAGLKSERAHQRRFRAKDGKA